MNALQAFIQSKPIGFLTKSDISELMKIDRLCPVLVRCGAVRFTCAVQYVETLIHCVEMNGDYLRDVSFPVGSTQRAANWKPERFLQHDSETPGSTGAAGCLGSQSGVEAHWNKRSPEFSESDCSGAFDGHQVTSDADPGL